MKTNYKSTINQLLAISILISISSSCALKPDLGKKSYIKSPAEYASVKSFAAPESNWPDENWWSGYNDPQLNQLVEEAIQGSPDMAAAKARLLQAQGRAEQNGAAISPTLSANASASEVKQSYNNGIPAAFVPQGWNDVGKATLNFNYELDFWGKNRSALASATSELQAAEVEAAQAKLALAVSVVSAYADLAQLYSNRDSAEEAVKVSQQSSKLFGERFNNGLENESGFRQSEASFYNSQNELATIDEQIALTKNRIAALIGAGPDRALDITRPKVDNIKPFGLPKNLSADLIGRRPDVIAARLRAEAAAKRINVARANFYPNINLAAYFGYESLGLDLLAKPGSSIGNIGPAINLPIFDGGVRSGIYRQARGEYEAAVASYNATLTRALQEVANVAVSEKALKTRLDKAKKALAASRSANKVANDRYKAGLATYMEVLTSEDRLIATRRAYSEVESRIFTLDVALVNALGGGYQSNSNTKE